MSLDSVKIKRLVLSSTLSVSIYDIMKNIFIYLSLALCLVGLQSSNSTDGFEGEITFEIEYISVPADMKPMESMLPKKMTMHLKDGKTRIDQGMMGGKQIIIVDPSTEKVHVLINLMGQKMHMETPVNEHESKNNATMKYVYKSEYKDVAGYKCQRVEATSSDGHSMVIYVTEEFAVNHFEFDGLKGFPLEYQVNQQGMELSMKALSLKETAIDDSQFEIPSGYNKVDPNMFKGMMR